MSATSSREAHDLVARFGFCQHAMRISARHL
jgi:hypothetical protein